MTRGRAATPDPFDLSAVSSSDELFDALSARRFAELSTEPADPAATLLAALVADVDVDAPPLATPSRIACGIQGSYRRGVRAFVTFGVVAAVLTSAGAAAANGGNGTGAMGNNPGSSRSSGSERSNENAQRHGGMGGTAVVGGKSPDHRAGDKERSNSPWPAGEPLPSAEDESHGTPRGWPQWNHRRPRTVRDHDKDGPIDHSPSPSPSSDHGPSDEASPTPQSDDTPATP